MPCTEAECTCDITRAELLQDSILDPAHRVLLNANNACEGCGHRVPRHTNPTPPPPAPTVAPGGPGGSNAGGTELKSKRRKLQDGEVPSEFDVKFGQFIKTKGLLALHAAHTKGVEPSLVYVRQPVVDIIQLLDDKGNEKGFWLKGAPGTGKSQVGRLWATKQAKQGKAVVYGEVRYGGYWVTKFANGKWEQEEFRDFDSFSFSLKVASDEDSSVVVFDGAAGKKGSLEADLAGYLLQAGGIVFSSGQLVCPLHPCDAEMTGWLLEECFAATDEEAFFQGAKKLAQEFKGDAKNRIERRAFIAEKYNTTGGSMRLMCEYTTEEAARLLAEAMDLLSADEQKDVLLGRFQPSHDKSKNILSQGFAHVRGGYDCGNVKHTFTSKLVLTKLRDSISLKEVRRLYFHCKNLHRVIEGWAFEELALRFLTRSGFDMMGAVDGHTMVKLLVRPEGTCAGDTNEQTWATVPFVSFNTKAFQEHKLLDLNGVPVMLPEFSSGVMLRPDVTNNESWDAVLVLPNDGMFCLIFVEVTLQKFHSFNEMADLQAFKTLNDLLGQKITPMVRHVGLVESQAFNDFKFIRTATLPTRELRSGESLVPECFSILCEVATITHPQV